MAAEPNPAQMFVANRYKALDYVFETNTNMALTMNLLALPTPSFPGSARSFPHDGFLPDVAYRTPWSRGKVIPTCKLFVSGSALEDLKRKQVHPPERFDISQREKSVGVMLKSDSEPFLSKLQMNPCDESFTKEQNTQKDVKDFLLPDDLITVDYLRQFTRNRPTLKAKLSRLKTLPVADPIGSFTRDAISEETMFRLCAYFKTPPGAISKALHTYADIPEQFEKAPFSRWQSLMLPCVADSMNVKQEHFTAFSRMVRSMNVFPEVQEGLPPLLDVLQTDVSQSLDISGYEISGEFHRETSNPPNPELAGHMMLPTDMELDVTLTPQTSQSSKVNFPLGEFQKEKLSPQSRRPLLSEAVQATMEAALWTAEKHPVNVASFLLAEPQILEPTVRFQPLPDACAILDLEKTVLSQDGDNLQSPNGMKPLQVSMCKISDFTEQIVSEIPFRKTQETEDFRRLSPEHPNVTDGTTFINLLSNTALPPHKKVVPTETNTLEQLNTVSREGMPETCQLIQPALKNKDIVPAPSAGETNTCLELQWDFTPQPPASPRERLSEEHRRSLSVKRCPPALDMDPLCIFMMLRAQQTSPVSEADQTPLENQCEQLPSPKLTQMSNLGLKVTSGAASRINGGEQKASAQSPASLIREPVNGDSREVAVKATDSQRRAYAELLSVAQPFLISVRQLRLKLPVGGDFRLLEPEQTRFLLKQQEKALSRAQAESSELVRELEMLLKRVTLIHVVVTVKELLLKCSLRTAMVYLSQRVELSTEDVLQQLLKRLQIIFHISQRNPESDLKLLEVQQQLSQWLHGSRSTTDRVLVLLNEDCERSRSVMINTLRVAGAAVTAVSPEAGKKKLNGAIVVNRIQGSVCMVACQQHMGPDFPWSCFSLVMEYPQPGHSPWAAVCKERNIAHLCFNTDIAGREEEEGVWCLEDHVPYVLLVTEGLLNSPLLLQTLESCFDMTLLERSHCASLQVFGGTQYYAVVTVDEKTAIMIQKEEELCHQKTSETLVMRLSALSLQYSCCWLILYCPGSQGGGLSCDAFSNLALVYSSLVLFSTKPEDLFVKTLIVSEMKDVAKWMSRICFHSLMNSDREPLEVLDRSWLSVIPSEEEMCLSQFPCVNPLVGQLMLRRAPSYQWLLGASISQLTELLPEVPQKVLKHFSDVTSLHTSSGGSHQRELKSPVAMATQQSHPASNLWTAATDSEVAYRHPQPEAPLGVQDWCLGPVAGSLSRSPGVHLQKSCTDGDGRKPRKFLDWGGLGGVMGGVVERETELSWIPAQETQQSPFKLESIFRRSPVQENLLTWSPDSRHFSPSRSPPAGVTPRGRSSSGGSAVSASYGSRFWMGQEWKRGSGDVATALDQGSSSLLIPLKRSRLSYERVPGRRDGQTRLKLF